MNFWMIFLCLAIGALVGYEFGKYTVSRRVREALDKTIDDLKITLEAMKKKQEEAKRMAEKGADEQ